MSPDLSRPAVVVVDMQQGLFAISDAPLHEPARLLSRVSNLVCRARATEVPVIYTRFHGPPGTPLHAAEPGSEIHSAVAPQPGDLVIDKDDSDAFLRTSLHEDLQVLGIDTLIVCGLQSEFCIDSTCRTAYALGYRVVLVEDAHSTTDTEDLTAAQIVAHHNRTLSRAYATRRRAEDVVLEWAPAPVGSATRTPDEQRRIT